MVNSLKFCMLIAAVMLVSCGKKAEEKDTRSETRKDTVKQEPKPISEPLIKEIYTADPSAHVFEGKIYIYPSHDIESGVPQDDLGSHFNMKDYHVLSMDSVGGKVTDHGVA